MDFRAQRFSFLFLSPTNLQAPYTVEGRICVYEVMRSPQSHVPLFLEIRYSCKLSRLVNDSVCVVQCVVGCMKKKILQPVVTALRCVAICFYRNMLNLYKVNVRMKEYKIWTNLFLILGAESLFKCV